MDGREGVGGTSGVRGAGGGGGRGVRAGRLPQAATGRLLAGCDEGGHQDARPEGARLRLHDVFCVPQPRCSSPWRESE